MQECSNCGRAPNTDPPPLPAARGDRKDGGGGGVRVPGGQEGPFA